MNSKVQSYGILLLTLLIGIVLGFILNGMLVRHRMEQVRSVFQNRDQRVEHLLDKINVTAQQRKIIKPILIEHFDKMHELNKQVRREMRSEMMDLRVNLGEYLDEDQMGKLTSEMRFFRRKRPRKNGRPPLPPPRPLEN
ncbi:MAG: hypothetical protein MRZ79_25330 [Bacteroidia bacterium]|nr:hypothetical protein [Bacteroidia bacterium]